MKDIVSFWKSGPVGKILIIGVGLLVLCCIVSIPVFLLDYQGGTSEPTQVPLSSSAHTPQVILTETPQLVTPDTNCAFCNMDCPVNSEGIDFCIVHPQLPADQPLFEARLKAWCDSKGGDSCKVLVWTDGQYLPSGLPVTEQQLNHQVADFGRSSGRDCLILLSAGQVIYQSEGCFG